LENNVFEANNYNEWIIYPPTKVEKMIKELKQINP